MADEEQLRILKEEGVEAWNKWRENHTDIEIDFNSAKLSGANLEGAILDGAILKDAILRQVLALVTNFKSATLTGACIEDWNINTETNLEGVICDYIYLKRDKQERRPSDPNRNFAPGEFTKLFQQALETVDLIFLDGIDWKAFLFSLKELQDEYGEENVGIQAIERKSGSAFVVRIEVPPDANKAEIESRAKESYETDLKVLEAQYRAELKGLDAHHKDEIISLRKEHNTQILELAKLAARTPIQ